MKKYMNIHLILDAAKDAIRALKSFDELIIDLKITTGGGVRI